MTREKIKTKIEAIQARLEAVGHHGTAGLLDDHLEELADEDTTLTSAEELLAGAQQVADAVENPQGEIDRARIPLSMGG